MRPVTFASITFSALGLVNSSPVNNHSSNELRDFATGLGLSRADVNTLSAAYGGSENGRVTDLSCQILNYLFQDNTYLPSEVSTYNAKIEINWSTRAWLNGTCVFSPSTTIATSIGVKVANFFNTQFAIRSGGHSPDPNMGSTSEGILFSLENLNQIHLDTTKNIASIGPGNRWGQVYENLDAQNFVVLGGRVPPVGVGGLLIGGGLSYFTGTEGFAADSVCNYEVVLGDGRVVNANANQNPDLWWALKGGGNNFGIVTRFDVKAIPKTGGLVWGGSLVFVPAQYPQVIKAIAEFQAKGQITDPKAAIIGSFIRSPSNGLDVARLTVFHQDPSDSPPASLQLFFDINPVQSTAMTRNLSSLAVDVFGPANGSPRVREYFRDFSMLVSEELYQKTFDIYNATFAPFDNVTGVEAILVYQPISVAMIDASSLTGGNPIGAPKKPQNWLNLNLGWVFSEDDDRMITAGKNFVAAVKAKAATMGLDTDFLYLNDASSDQPVMKGYGAANLKRLQKISHTFDPQQVFQKRVTGGFKLN